MRFGYRRLTAMLVREGTPANHKRVYRLYRDEGLVHAHSAATADPLEWNGGPARKGVRPNQRWSIDFVSDS
jgi:putative transposase